MRQAATITFLLMTLFWLTMPMFCEYLALGGLAVEGAGAGAVEVAHDLHGTHDEHDGERGDGRRLELEREGRERGEREPGLAGQPVERHHAQGQGEPVAHEEAPEERAELEHALAEVGEGHARHEGDGGDEPVAGAAEVLGPGAAHAGDGGERGHVGEGRAHEHGAAPTRGGPRGGGSG